LVPALFPVVSGLQDSGLDSGLARQDADRGGVTKRQGKFRIDRGTSSVKGGIGNILKQAQKMQEDLQMAQERLAREEVTGESGGGMVKVIMNGRHEVKRVEIDPSLLADDKEMLEDLVAAAVNGAVQKVAEKTQEGMASLTSGLGNLPLPPGFKMPF
jgi:hypothetical protein